MKFATVMYGPIAANTSPSGRGNSVESRAQARKIAFWPNGLGKILASRAAARTTTSSGKSARNCADSERWNTANCRENAQLRPWRGQSGVGA
jgi:hypothetical protein